MEAEGWKKLRDGRWKKWVIDNDRYGGQMMEEMGDDGRTGCCKMGDQKQEMEGQRLYLGDLKMGN